MRVAPSLLCVVVAASGCLFDPHDYPDCGGDPSLSSLAATTMGVDVDMPILAWVTNRGDETANVTLFLMFSNARTHGDERAEIEVERLGAARLEALGPNETFFGIVRWKESWPASGKNFSYGNDDFVQGVHLVARATDGDCTSDAFARHGVLPGEPRKTVAPGHGAMVRTAGLWLNGTLFYTNMGPMHNSTVSRAGWYEWEGDDPLKVYVYNQSRAELPKRYNQSGFLTTIPGFNEALKGMNEREPRIVIIPPEKAYTRPGNEKHHLYGDTLLFFIEVLDVKVVPCPLPAGPYCELPV